MARTFSGRQLRQTRIKAGVSTERLALSIGRSAYSIHEYERGRVHPPVNVLSLAAAVLGCSVDDLLADDGVATSVA